MLRNTTIRLIVCLLIAAAVGMLLAAAFSPRYPLGAISLLGHAIACVTAVFCAASIAAYLGLKNERRTASSRSIVFRAAMVAVWLPPLLLFFEQRSWLALLLWIVVVIDATHLGSILAARASTSPVAPPETAYENSFAVLKQDQPYATSIIAAFMMQGAIFAGLADHVALAGLLYLSGTAAIAHRCYRMFRDSPSPDNARFTPRTAAVLATATFFLVFAWLPYLTSGGAGSASNSMAGGEGRQSYSNGTGPGGNKHRNHANGDSSSLLARLKTLLRPKSSEGHTDSFSAAKRIFSVQFPENASGTGDHPRHSLSTNMPVAVLVAGPIFPGVELYPDVQPATKLVAPSSSALHRSVETSQDDPLSIPFNGVYWFWTGPSSLPPPTSIVMHGSPSARFFRSVDGEGMSMEAKQNLGFAVRPERFGSIEIDIQNADPFPNSVNILLKIRNTRIPDTPAQWLGMKEVSTPASQVGSLSRQTLRFSIPATLAMGTFDELTVTYYLKGARVNRSARIAIDHFRLVPRGA